MRVVQIIDSLEAGGAERMAVNYANALSKKLAFSGIVVTRAEGALKAAIDPSVNYLFLHRTRTLDFKAAKKVGDYCVQNKVDVLHAHSSSYFIAILTKIMLPKLQIIWHDHNGLSEFLDKRPVLALRLASYFFSGIIVVNALLKNWAVSKLNCADVVYFPNFPSPINKNVASGYSLNGVSGKRILCLANLRPQKNHLMLLDVAAKISALYPEWTFHLVGKDFGDSYSETIKNRIIAENLQENVFLYGSINDTENVIAECEIAVITSVSEGLPVSVLECGAAQKAVVVTDVGELAAVVASGKSGFVVESQNVESFAAKLAELIRDEGLRRSFGIALQKTVADNYSEAAVIGRYLQWLEKIVHVR